MSRRARPSTRRSSGIKKELNERSADHARGRPLLEAQRLEQRVQFDLEMMAATGVVRTASKTIPATSPAASLANRRRPCSNIYQKTRSSSATKATSPCRRSARCSAATSTARRTLAEYGFRLPSCMDNRPLKFEEWEKMRPQTTHVSATPGGWELERTGGVFTEQVIRPTGLVDPAVESAPRHRRQNQPGR